MIDTNPLYARVDNIRKIDREAFDRQVARIFGPPDYSEAPELKGYFGDVAATAAELHQKELQRHNEAIAKKVLENATRERDYLRERLKDATGKLEEERRRSRTLLTAAREEWEARLPRQADFTVTPATSTTPPELATAA